ncbi:MAG: hypothetical protein GC152_03560 [Alphaproteobacteria bacterium]|nr:hypothetical protein [Alphaproteobacteria bacterium]
MKHRLSIPLIAAGATLAASIGLASVAFAQPDPDSGVMKQLKENGEAPVSAFADAAAKRAAALDADNDGVVTTEEMRAHHAKMREARASRRFPDANDDGVVSEVEFLDAARERFARIDKDGDGVVTKDEMPKGRGHRRGHKGSHRGDGR